MPRSTLGLIVGLVLGYAAIYGGFGAMLIVALLGVVGFVTGKALEGDLGALGEQLNDALRRR